MSLRGRILLLATGTAALVIVLAAVPIALLLRSAAYDAAERDARNAAQSTADYLSTSAYDDRVLTQYLDRLNSRGRSRVCVVMGDGDVLGAKLSDDDLPAQPPGPRDLGYDHDHDNLGQVTSARVESVADGRLVQVDAQSRQGVARVFALAPDSSVRDEVLHRGLLVAATALVLLLLAALAAEVTSRRLARPLERTAATAVALSGGDLLARAPIEGPLEVSRVAIELNALADRIDELLAQERETTADLSHRLRTPLTAVRLSVESLPAGPAKQELETQVATLERTLTQVIRAARRPQREGVHPRCDAVEVVRERVAFWRPLAEDQGREVTVRLPSAEVPVRAAAEDLGAALDALLENVFAHTEDGVAFEISVSISTGHPVIEVLDDGPGIPPAALPRGRSDRDSTGLGLDIARSFAEGTGGTLSLVSGGGPTGDRHGDRHRDRHRDRHGVRLVLRAPQAPHGKP